MTELEFNRAAWLAFYNKHKPTLEELQRLLEETFVEVALGLCDHCGKPERFNVLCGDCEQLCCPNGCTGRVNECVCDTAAPTPDGELAVKL